MTATHASRAGAIAGASRSVLVAFVLALVALAALVPEAGAAGLGFAPPVFVDTQLAGR